MEIVKFNVSDAQACVVKYWVDNDSTWKPEYNEIIANIAAVSSRGGRNQLIQIPKEEIIIKTLRENGFTVTIMSHFSTSAIISW